jgi:hypothetical protein
MAFFAGHTELFFRINGTSEACSKTWQLPAIAIQTPFLSGIYDKM